MGSLLGLAGPYSLQFLVDAVFKNNSATLLNQIALVLIGIFLLQSVFYFIRAYLLAFIGERVMADLRLRLFEHLQGLSLSFFNERRTGELVSRLTNDVSTRARAGHQRHFHRHLAGAHLYRRAGPDRHHQLAPDAVHVRPDPGGHAGGHPLWPPLRGLSATVQDQLATATTVLEETIGGVRVVQSFAREALSRSNASATTSRSSFELAMRRTRLSALFGPLISFLAFAAVVSIFWFGGHEVLAGRLTAGQFFMFLVLTMTIAGSIGQFSGLWTGLQETLGATQRLFEILDTHQRHRRPAPARAWPRRQSGAASPSSRSPLPTKTTRSISSCPRSISKSARAKCWPWSGRAARARPPWST